MKAHAVSLVTAAMFLTAAWLTGCDSTEETATESATRTTQAQETTAMTTIAATTAEAEADSYCDDVTEHFDCYDAFLTALGEYYPGIVMVAPTPIVQAEWEVTCISLDYSEKPQYTYEVVDLDGNQVTLFVSHKTADQYDSMEALLEMLYSSDTITVLDAYVGSRWAIVEMDSTGAYIMYGMTGDENLYYTCRAIDVDGVSVSPDVLMEVHDSLML